MGQQKQESRRFMELRKIAEEKLAAQRLTTREPDIKSLRHELSVHEVELEMQNEELQRTQAVLDANLKQYQRLFEFSPAAYFILDMNGNIENVNLRGIQQIGMEKHQLIGMPFANLIHSESSQDQFYRLRKLAASSASIEHMELEITRGEGTVFPALVKGMMCGEGNESKHLLTMVNDLSSSREYQRQIKAALDKAEELNEMKSRFVSMASHEFRTPLATILTSTTLAEKYADTDQKDNMKRHLNKIKSSVSQLTLILDEFLSLEKIESGKVMVSPYEFDIKLFCQNLIEDIRSTMKSGQQINYRHEGDNEVHQDKAILRHVLVNLLTNACKYSPQDKEIDLCTTVKEDCIEISVKDRGIGIPEDEQHNVFSRFFRAKNVATIQGTGLGLNIVKGYVDLLDGRIDFTSRPNEGSTFLVWLPLMHPAQD